MGKRDRTCSVCQKRYQYCPTCTQDRMKPYWMLTYCSESCKDIWDICTQYNMKLLTKTEARKALSACDLSGRDTFADNIKADLTNIYTTTRRTKRVDPQAEESTK